MGMGTVETTPRTENVLRKPGENAIPTAPAACVSGLAHAWWLISDSRSSMSLAVTLSTSAMSARSSEPTAERAAHSGAEETFFCSVTRREHLLR